MGFKFPIKSETDAKKFGSERDNFDNELSSLGKQRRASILGNGNDKSGTGSLFSKERADVRKGRQTFNKSGFSALGNS